jgi:Protein of unknown function (DUF3617)
MIRNVAAAAALLAALAIVPSARADGLNAKPGLWKTTIEAESNGTKQPPRSGERCIKPEDIQQANRGFLLDPAAPNNPCKRTDFHSSATSIDWKYECTGQVTMTSQGSIKFDTPQHYTGTVSMKGTVMGNAINNVMHMDGKWVGACAGGGGS